MDFCALCLVEEEEIGWLAYFVSDPGFLMFFLSFILLIRKFSREFNFHEYLKTFLRRQKLAIRDWFTYISKRQSDFTISRGFYFHETSHAKFRKNKTLAKICKFTVVNKWWAGYFEVIIGCINPHGKFCCGSIFRLCELLTMFLYYIIVPFISLTT